MKMHGLTRTPVWNAWKGMHSRCKYKGSKYHHAKGIKVCARWDDFLNFFTDMGHPPKGFQLDRIDGTKDYTPLNCRWVTPMQNSNNKSNNKFWTYNGETHTQAEWARKVGLKPRILKQRLFKGWCFERAIMQKPRKGANL